MATMKNQLITDEEFIHIIERRVSGSDKRSKEDSKMNQPTQPEWIGQNNPLDDRIVPEETTFFDGKWLTAEEIVSALNKAHNTYQAFEYDGESIIMRLD